MSNPYQQYQQTSVETASPTRLVVMLYDGAIRFLNRVLPAMETKTYDQQSYYINKAQAIIIHLKGTLNFEVGGEVAKQLDIVYTQMFNTLTDANINDKQDRVKEVISALRELREAWVEVDRQFQVEKAEVLADQTSDPNAPLMIAA